MLQADERRNANCDHAKGGRSEGRCFTCYCTLHSAFLPLPANKLAFLCRMWLLERSTDTQDYNVIMQ